QFGWKVTIQFYLVLLLLFIAMNFFLGDRQEKKEKTKLGAQIKAVYKNEKIWFFSIFYFITFGSFVAFPFFLPSFFVDFFDLSNVYSVFRTSGLLLIAS